MPRAAERGGGRRRQRAADLLSSLPLFAVKALPIAIRALAEICGPEIKVGRQKRALVPSS